MGWSSEHVDLPIPKKAVCDEGFRSEYEILRSAMVGNVHYAALKDQGTGAVFAAITLTSVDNSDWYNFMTKTMHEDEGPVEAKCPESILDLLTETDSEFASDWRDRCRTYSQNARQLKSLPYGSSVSCGQNEYVKTRIGNKTYWVNTARKTYIPATELAESGYVVCKKGGKEK